MSWRGQEEEPWADRVRRDLKIESRRAKEKNQDYQEPLAPAKQDEKAARGREKSEAGSEAGYIQ